jgi:hypothetical protein
VPQKKKQKRGRRRRKRKKKKKTRVRLDAAHVVIAPLSNVLNPNKGEYVVWM